MSGTNTSDGTSTLPTALRELLETFVIRPDAVARRSPIHLNALVGMSSSLATEIPLDFFGYPRHWGDLFNEWMADTAWGTFTVLDDEGVLRWVGLGEEQQAEANAVLNQHATRRQHTHAHRRRTPR